MLPTLPADGPPCAVAPLAHFLPVARRGSMNQLDPMGEALRTGKPQNEIKLTGKPMFVEL
jgi:hypothetical protein